MITVDATTIEEMKAEGLDILIEFFKEKPEASTHEARRHYSNEWSELIGMPGTPCLPHPLMVVVARKKAKEAPRNGS